jgi:SOS-response transcriptional repressor LexA
MRQPLTEKQAEVLLFIAEHQRAHQWAPTRREIAQHFGWRSLNAADEKVRALIRKGWLARRGGPHASRDVIVVGQD